MRKDFFGKKNKNPLPEKQRDADGHVMYRDTDDN